MEVDENIGKLVENKKEIFEINRQAGIQIWSATQEHLEGQALKEFDLFLNETRLHKSENTKPSTSADHLYTELYTNEIEVELQSEEVIIEEVVETAQELQTALTEEFTEEAQVESGSDYQPSDDDNCSDSDYCPELNEVKSTIKKPKNGLKKKEKRKLIKTVKDDALIKNYERRLKKYYKKLENEISNADLSDSDPNSDIKLKGGLKVPRELWRKLYGYQQDGLKWLWELHQKPSGGLLGDEMGLGKTVQIIVFLHCLQYSRIISKHCKFIGVGGSIIVCPATVVHQWVKHFHDWCPEFRVAVLHQSGTHQGNKAKLIKEINLSKGILITTYMGILKYKGIMVEYNWHYLILDEGHKIRNPTAKITVAVKKIRTPHRIMLTGSPMQNNLTELWSLFDFTNPGMLGELTAFQQHFITPILQGGAANASPMQEATALSVATTLKNVISPFLLRRSKAEFKKVINLPHKSEQVLFCSLTREQRDMYKDYLMGEQVNTILGRGFRDWRSKNFMRASMLMAITSLRKICNHPDLYLYDKQPSQDLVFSEDNKFGYYKRSGKMVVVSALLKIWKKQGQRVLLFTQGRGMIKVFEQFLSQQGYKFVKMDGTTSVSARQKLIESFNKNESYFVFLLTTRVGGIGVNLTGANRVIIYDPDWNPATDTQARERSWRIGQRRSVTIYRLISAGTIEEKMYQRQVWKQLLSNKVLVDPSTNKFFKNSDLYDLFSLPADDADPRETNIFHDYRVKVQENIEAKERAKKEKKEKDKKSENQLESNENTESSTFSDDRLEKMRELAKKIAKSLSSTNLNIETAEPQKKSSYQLELEKQRKQKLKKKQKLKILTPSELLEYNRKKAKEKQDDNLNLIDGQETNVSFESALEYGTKTAKLYYKLNEKKGIRKRSCDSNTEDEPASKISKSDYIEKNKTNYCGDFSGCNRLEKEIDDKQKKTNAEEDPLSRLSENCSQNEELEQTSKKQPKIVILENSILKPFGVPSKLKFKKIKKPPDNTKNLHSENDERLEKVPCNSTSIQFLKEVEGKRKDKKNKEKEESHKKSKRHKVDTSGEIDGEQVEGLVKRETKKIKSKSAETDSANDSFILEHLFTNAGVSSAVEHESVISGKRNNHSFQVREEAERKAAKALEALKPKKERFYM